MGDIAGVPAFVGFLQSWLDAFPDATFELSNVIAEGDLAAWHVRFVRTNTGSLMGMPATGKSVDVVSVEMGRFAENGQTIEHWTGNVQFLLMQQLDLLPDMAASPS